LPSRGRGGSLRVPRAEGGATSTGGRTAPPQQRPVELVDVVGGGDHDHRPLLLLEPSRLDQQLVRPPGAGGAAFARGREAILRAHAKGKPLADDLNLTDVARKTTGMTGAQLANALNEAASSPAAQAATRSTARKSTRRCCGQSVGSQQARRLSLKERRIVAYHEAGHALCRKLLGLDPPEILSIVPRGPALGFVGHSPSEDSYLKSRDELVDEVVTLLRWPGGRRKRCSASPTRGRSTTSPGCTWSASSGRRIRHGRGGSTTTARPRSRCRPVTTRLRLDPPRRSISPR